MTNELQHFGVLGMKWGRRKAATQRDEDRWVQKAMSRETYVKVHNRMSSRLNSTEIPRINNKPEYKGKNFNLPENKKLYAKYNKEFADTVLKIANEEMNAIMGPSPLGRKIVITDGGNGNTVYTLEEIKHADGTVVFVAKRDANGQIVSITMDSDAALTQDDSDEGLKHYGVLGMRWGHRKAGSQAHANYQAGLKALTDSGKSNDTDAIISLSKKYDSERRAEQKAAFDARVSAGKALVSKISNNSVFKATIFNKDKSILTSAGRSAAKAKLRSVAEKLERASVRGQDRDIANLKTIVAGYKKTAMSKPLSSRDQKLMKEFEDHIKFMEDELNSLYTPEELKKYRES